VVSDRLESLVLPVTMAIVFVRPPLPVACG
jgi:hypothetical protein